MSEDNQEKSKQELSQKKSDKDLTPILKQEEKLTFLLEKIMGDDLHLNDKHIDEMLAQRREVNSFIHTERMQKHERFKMLSQERIRYFVGIIIFIAILGLAILIFRPDQFQTFLFVIVGIFGGLGLKELFKPPKE